MSSSVPALETPCKRPIRQFALAAAGMVALGLGGCGTPGGPVFPPPAEPLAWPGPPEPARVRYVGQLLQSTDLKPGRNAFQVLGDAIFGQEEPDVMNAPNSVCTDGAGRVFVADGDARVVHVFDFETRNYARWPKANEDASILAYPIGVASDGQGQLLVADAAAGLIQVFDATGNPTEQLGAGTLQRPCGLAVDAERQRIYVADPGLHSVVVLGMDGQVIHRFGGRGSAPGQFNFPTHLAVDGSGRLLVSDSLNFRVQIFGPDFEYISQFGRQGDMPGYFAAPKGIAIDSDGHIYVVDARFEAVQIFDDEGTLLLTFGEEGTAPGRFWLPIGISIDENDRIWIADSYNQRVQVFDYLKEAQP